MIHTERERFTLHTGDAAEIAWDLEPGSVQCIVTSPPYFGLRDYGHEAQSGREATLQDYVTSLVAVFESLRSALVEDGTFWLNLGDSYANDGKWGGSTGGKHASDLHGGTGIGRGKVRTGLAPKNLIGIPWRVALALQEAGWILRSDVIWAKPNPTPEPVADRPTKSHEYLFMLAKSARYYYDADAVREPASGRAPGNRTHKYAEAAAAEPGGHHRTKGGLAALTDTVYETRNRRDVWTIASAPFAEAHFATFPPALAEVCVLAGSRRGDTVLDPFAGSSTTGMVALRHGRRYIGIDVNAEYHDLALRTRLKEWM